RILPCPSSLPRSSGGSASTSSLLRNTRGLDKHEFIAELAGLPLEFLFETLLSLCIPCGPGSVVVLNLLRFNRVEDDCASFGALAVMPAAGPSLAFIRRKKPPRRLRL